MCSSHTDSEQALTDSSNALPTGDRNRETWFRDFGMVFWLSVQSKIVTTSLDIIFGRLTKFNAGLEINKTRTASWDVGQM